MCHQSNQQARETTTILAGQADIVHSVAMDAKEELTSVRQNLNQEAKEIQNILASQVGMPQNIVAINIVNSFFIYNFIYIFIVNYCYFVEIVFYLENHTNQSFYISPF